MPIPKAAQCNTGNNMSQKRWLPYEKNERNWHDSTVSSLLLLDEMYAKDSGKTETEYKLSCACTHAFARAMQSRTHSNS